MCKNFQVILFSQFFRTVQKRFRTENNNKKKNNPSNINSLHGVTVYTNKKATVTRDVKASVQGWSCTEGSKQACARSHIGLCFCKISELCWLYLRNCIVIEKCPQKTVFDLLTLNDLEISTNVNVAT